MSALISAAYLEEQRKMHAAPRGYGQRGDKWAQAVLGLVVQYGATSILDYGCGAGTLVTALKSHQLNGLRIDEYDPAIPGKDSKPSFADLVVCTDVLEHIEPDRLDSVLAHLKLLARKAVFAVIATRPAKKKLSDGRNAHLIIEDDAWWMERLVRAGFVVTPGPPSPSKNPAKELSVVLPCQI